MEESNGDIRSPFTVNDVATQPLTVAEPLPRIEIFEALRGRLLFGSKFFPPGQIEFRTSLNCPELQIPSCWNSVPRNSRRRPPPEKPPRPLGSPDLPGYKTKRSSCTSFIVVVRPA